MSTYTAAATWIHRKLERFRGVHKSLVFAGLSGIAALLGSLVGLLANPFPPGFLHVAFWDVFVGLGVGLSIAVVQNWHIGRLEVAGGDLLKAGAWSALGGLLGGSALVVFKEVLGGVSGLFGGGPTWPHVFGWTAESLLIAFFVSKSIPNLSSRAALLAGTGAGLLGGLLTGFYVPVALGDAFKGIFLGLAIALAEQMVKQAWVVLHRQVPATALASRSLVLLERPPTLLLGDKPILIGSSRECEILVDTGARSPATIASLELRDEAIVYDDRIAGHRRRLRHGDQIQLDGLTLEVGSRQVETPEPEPVTTS